jgi:hypothetical protein
MSRDVKPLPGRRVAFLDLIDAQLPLHWVVTQARGATSTTQKRLPSGSSRMT